MTCLTPPNNQVHKRVLQQVQQELRAKMRSHVQAYRMCVGASDRLVQALVAAEYLSMINKLKREVNAIERETGGNR
jgi:hypothetical protein